MKSVFLLSLLVAISSSYKVVFLAPGFANSQILFNVRVAEILANGGHDVTIVLFDAIQGSTDSTLLKYPANINIRHLNISIGLNKDEMEKSNQESIFVEESFFDAKARKHLEEKLQFMKSMCKDIIGKQDFMKWLADEKFDIAFAHMYDLCTIGMIHKAEIPTWIWLNTGKIMDYVATVVGVPIIPSYVSPMMMAAHDTLTFTERVKSFVGTNMMNIIWPHAIAHPETAMFREQFGPDFPDLLDLAAQCPLVFVNSNDLYSLAAPTLAKVVNIGGVGMQTKDVEPLPKEFEDIVNKGDGVVIMTFGSVAPAHLMPEHWKAAFFGAFKRFPNIQFILRYNSNDWKDKLPSNVHLFKWIPQMDLLQNPRTKAIITHGGYNSLQEAISAGKPLITIPLFGDQPKNAKIAEKYEIAVILTKTEIVEDNIYEALDKILNNPIYIKNSIRFRDMVQNQPNNPATTVLKWTEFLAKFQKVESFQPAGLKLNTLQYFSLDVMLFLATIIFTVLFILYKIVKFTVCRLFSFGAKTKTE